MYLGSTLNPNPDTFKLTIKAIDGRPQFDPEIQIDFQNLTDPQARFMDVVYSEVLPGKYRTTDYKHDNDKPKYFMAHLILGDDVGKLMAALQNPDLTNKKIKEAHDKLSGPMVFPNLKQIEVNIMRAVEAFNKMTTQL